MFQLSYYLSHCLFSLFSKSSIFSRVYPILCFQLVSDGANKHDPIIVKFDLHIWYPNPDKCISFNEVPSCFWKDTVLNQSSSLMYSCYLCGSFFQKISFFLHSSPQHNYFLSVWNFLRWVDGSETVSLWKTTNKLWKTLEDSWITFSKMQKL